MSTSIENSFEDISEENAPFVNINHSRCFTYPTETMLLSPTTSH